MEASSGKNWKSKKHNRTLIILLIIFAIFATIFFLSGYKLLENYQANQIQTDAFAELSRNVEQVATKDSILQAGELGGILPEYAEIYAENDDLWGWLKIEGTEIDYPIMHTPNAPEYYLHRDFQGNYASMGVPFLDAACYDTCQNYLIYGHNMKNGTMFAPILAYTEEDFYTEHQFIQLDTMYEHGTYTVIAAFYSQVYERDDTDVFRYYRYTDLSDEAVFNDYTEQIRATALYDTDFELASSDTLLTLSTCSYHTENGRFVVVAKKI